MERTTSRLGAAPAAASLRSQLTVASRSRSFRRLLVIVTAQSAATGAQLAGAPYLARPLLDDAAAVSLGGGEPADSH
jgi:hypothetical protein